MGNYDDFWAQADPTPPAAPAPTAYSAATAAPEAPAHAASPGFAPPAAPAGWAPTPYTAPPLGPAATGAWAPPGHGAPSTTASRPSALLRYGGGFIGVVLLLGVGVTAFEKFRSIRPLATPESLAGATRLRGAEFDELTERTKDSIRDGGDRAVAGIYGVDGAPSIIMAAGSGHDYDSLEDSASDVMRGIKQAGFTVDVAQAANYDDGRGKDVRCAAFSTPASGSVCIWLTGRSTGLVFQFGADPAATAQLTGEAREAVEV